MNPKPTIIHDIMPSNYEEKELLALLLKVRIFNKAIGNYKLHAITPEFDFAVKLSNGRILITMEELQAEVEGELAPENLMEIAKRFIPAAAEENDNYGTKNRLFSTRAPGKKSGRYKSAVVVFVGLIVVLTVLTVAAATIGDSNNDNDTAGDSIGSDYADDSGSGEKSSTSVPSATYEEAAVTLEQKELDRPLDFLSVSGSWRETLLGDKLKIKCRITNSARVALFKDAVVRITYYAKSGTELGSVDETVYQVFEPGTTTTVELKVDNYRNVSEVGWVVVQATGY